MKSRRRNTLLASALALGLTVSATGCEVSVNGNQDEETEAPTKPEKTKKKPKAAKESPPKEDVDVDALLNDPGETSGVLKSVDLDGLNTSKAPRLGSQTATQGDSIKDAEWLLLPGNTLQIPNPPNWQKKRDAMFGILLSPDKKAGMAFAPYTTLDDVKNRLNDIGRLVKITNVKWKDAKTVRLGPDAIPAIVRGGEATSESGEKMNILFALIETGQKQRVIAISVIDHDAPKTTRDQAVATIIATRKRR